MRRCWRMMPSESRAPFRACTAWHWVAQPWAPASTSIRCSVLRCCWWATRILQWVSVEHTGATRAFPLARCRCLARRSGRCWCSPAARPRLGQWQRDPAADLARAEGEKSEHTHSFVPTGWQMVAHRHALSRWQLDSVRPDADSLFPLNDLRGYRALSAFGTTIAPDKGLRG